MTINYKQSHNEGASDLRTPHFSCTCNTTVQFQKISFEGKIFPLAVAHVKKATLVGAFTLQILFHEKKWRNSLEGTL